MKIIEYDIVEKKDSRLIFLYHVPVFCIIILILLSIIRILFNILPIPIISYFFILFSIIYIVKEHFFFHYLYIKKGKIYFSNESIKISISNNINEVCFDQISYIEIVYDDYQHWIATGYKFRKEIGINNVLNIVTKENNYNLQFLCTKYSDKKKLKGLSVMMYNNNMPIKYYEKSHIIINNN